MFAFSKLHPKAVTQNLGVYQDVLMPSAGCWRVCSVSDGFYRILFQKLYEDAACCLLSPSFCFLPVSFLRTELRRLKCTKCTRQLSKSLKLRKMQEIFMKTSNFKKSYGRFWNFRLVEPNFWSHDTKAFDSLISICDIESSVLCFREYSF